MKPILLLDTLKATDFAPSLTVQGLGDAVGGAQEDQRVLLVLGGHVSVHQHQPAVAPRRAQRRRLLRLPGRGGVQRPEGAELHQPGERQPVRAARWVPRCALPLLHSCLKATTHRASLTAANHSAKQCRTPCAMRSTCSECTSSSSSECMWCSNMKQCVDSNAYVASFPFGQCMEWCTMNTCPRKTCLVFLYSFTAVSTVIKSCRRM